MWYLALLKRCRSLYIRNLLGSYPPSWLQTGPNHEYSGSNAAMCPSINVPAFAASWPHRHCTSPCPEYRCRSSDAHSGFLFATRYASTNHSAEAGFPAIGQHANVIPRNFGGASAYPEHRYAVKGTGTPARSEHTLSWCIRGFSSLANVYA